MRQYKSRLNAQLRDGLRREEGLDHLTDLPACFAPDEGFRGAALAGFILRQQSMRQMAGYLDKAVPLATKPLPVGPKFTPGVNLFHGIVNSSLQAGENGQGLQQRWQLVYEGGCAMAERTYSGLLSSLRGEPDSPQHGMRIIFDKDEPLLLHKSEGEPTALSLRPVIIDGVEYPAGSMLGVHVRSDYVPERNRYLPNFSNGQTEIASVDEVDGATFLRLTSFAVEPEHRSPYTEHLGGPDMSWWALPTFRHLGQTSIHAAAEWAQQRVADLSA